MQNERETQQAPMTISTLFEIFQQQYKSLDKDEKKFMDQEDLIPYLILADWVTDSCEQFPNHELARMSNMFDALDVNYEGFYHCKAALEEAIKLRDP